MAIGIDKVAHQVKGDVGDADLNDDDVTTDAGPAKSSSSALSRYSIGGGRTGVKNLHYFLSPLTVVSIDPIHTNVGLNLSLLCRIETTEKLLKLVD